MGSTAWRLLCARSRSTSNHACNVRDSVGIHAPVGGESRPVCEDVGLVPDRERMRATLTPDLLAVELADALVEAGVPFRDAHAAVGRLWAAAESSGVAPAALPEPARLALSPHFTAARLAELTVESALARRDHAPGGGRGSVAEQLATAAERLGLVIGSVAGPERTGANAETGGTRGARDWRSAARLSDGGAGTAGPSGAPPSLPA